MTITKLNKFENEIGERRFGTKYKTKKNRNELKWDGNKETNYQNLNNKSKFYLKPEKKAIYTNQDNDPNHRTLRAQTYISGDRNKIIGNTGQYPKNIYLKSRSSRIKTPYQDRNCKYFKFQY